tara:strand:+ start:8162 stop:9598 length:1437 start_codon:yes stop_codon:yes gene_type:complete
MEYTASTRAESPTAPPDHGQHGLTALDDSGQAMKDRNSQPATELIVPRWLITMAGGTAQVLSEQAVAVASADIIAVGHAAELRQQYAGTRVTELPHHVLIPGLVNAHGHAAMTLFRGLADDRDLMTWLQEHIWPAEAAHVSEQFATCGVELAIAEMLRSGTTCFSDMYYFPEVTAKVATRLHMRTQIAFPVLDFPTVWASDADEYLRKGTRLLDDYRDDALVKVAFGPHAPYTVSDEPLKRIAVLADELDADIQVHLHETAHEVEESLKIHGKRPIQRLAELGCLTQNTQCVHMTQLTDSDIGLLQTSHAKVIHSPESNLKLASGFCPVQKLLDAGVVVGIGTDGAASNNDLDLLLEMRTAALIGKAVSGNAAAVSASAVLNMATLGGATALGLADRCGSIEVGKAADLTAITLTDPSAQPCYDLVSHLAYSVNSRDVSDVWVGGRRQLERGLLVGIDTDRLLAEVGKWRETIAGSKG